VALCVVQLSRAVEWLCTESPRLPLTIESQSVVDFVEDGLTSHFFTPMLQDLSERQKLGAMHAVSLIKPLCFVAVATTFLL